VSPDAATASAIQPMIKAVPPSGVIAPSHFMPVKVMVWREPEKSPPTTTHCQPAPVAN